jgi:3',5'-cyclic AMP phosphodiesterase CpdA
MTTRPDTSSLTRREMLRLSAGGLAALTLAPSAFASSVKPQSFRFVVINDIHCRDERCQPWFRKIVSSIHKHAPDFCLINGDLCENGLPEQLTPVKEIFGALGIPLYATLGNHDYFTDASHPAFDQIFPNSLNYHFTHAGWQFIGLDSTDGRRVVFTMIQQHTLDWLDATLPTLDPAKPTVICTHFPLGDAVLCRPWNADAILTRFAKFNLRATFSGHWHGYALRHFDHADVINSRCGSWWRINNDASPQKGYHLCEALPTGEVKRTFCVIS